MSAQRERGHLHGHCILPITDPEMRTHEGPCDFEYDDYCEDSNCIVLPPNTIPAPFDYESNNPHETNDD